VNCREKFDRPDAQFTLRAQNSTFFARAVKLSTARLGLSLFLEEEENRGMKESKDAKPEARPNHPVMAESESEEGQPPTAIDSPAARLQTDSVWIALRRRWTRLSPEERAAIMGAILYAIIGAAIAAL
jgi:hypothetical protein